MTTELSDEALIDQLERAAFDYFLTAANPVNGLVADRADDPARAAPASIAVVGFALSVYPVGVERGWMTRDEGVARTLVTLRFFTDSAQNGEPGATGYRGLYYHFLDRTTGARTWTCELSTMDSALLLAGVLTAAAYFCSEAPLELQIRQLADTLYRRADWRWALAGGATLVHGWKPECGFLNYRWEGYNEGLLLYVLALGSPTHPLEAESYEAWTHTYEWDNLYGTEYLFARALFMHQFSHAWLDFRGIRDRFMRDKRSDYFQNSQRAIDVQRAYAVRNPQGYAGYGENTWGLTASDGPVQPALRVDGVDRPYLGYAARGVPYGPDDGTIASCAALACLPFAPGPALAAARETLRRRPAAVLASGFNPSQDGWISPGHFGLDLGLVVMMLENHRTGLNWKLLRGSAYIRAGLVRAGFTGGWL